MAVVGHFQPNPKKRDTRQQSIEMKLDTLVTIVLLIRFALSVLWFVVECGQKGHCHGQLDEQQLQFLLFVHKLQGFSFT
jgi:hypothetical protein